VVLTKFLLLRGILKMPPIGSMLASNLLGGGDQQAKKQEADRKEAEKKKTKKNNSNKASEEGGFESQISHLWDQATGARKDQQQQHRDQNGGGLVPQMSNLWDSATGGAKRKEKPKAQKKNSSWLGSFSSNFNNNNNNKSGIKSLDLGPAVAVGIGCGVGIGVGVTGAFLLLLSPSFVSSSITCACHVFFPLNCYVPVELLCALIEKSLKISLQTIIPHAHISLERNWGITF
jgi:hypothetical protein